MYDFPYVKRLLTIKLPSYMKKRLLFFSIVYSLVGFHDLYGQCGTETFTVTDWCENQFAEWEIANPDPDARYRWYQLEKDEDGNIIHTSEYQYGANENGTRFVSPTRYTTPDPTPITPNWDSRTFYYVKEKDVQFAPTVPTATNNTNNGDSPTYGVNFTTTVRTEFHDVTVPAFSYYLPDNQTYHIQIRIGTYYSEVFTFQKGNTQQIGNVYFIKVPVDISVEPGNYTMEVITNPAPASLPGGTTPIPDGFAWMPANTYTFPVNNTEGLTITGSTSLPGGNQAMIFEWNTTTYCPIKETPPAKKTAVGCCTPVIGSVSISATEPIIVSGTDNTTLTITNYVNATNTFMWYKDGAALGHTGMSYSTNQAGVYSVREIENASFANNISCYAEGLIEIQERALFARLLSAPKAEYCVGDEIEIEAYGDITSLKWTPEAFVQNPTSKITKAVLGVEASSLNFIVEGDIITDNRIINGDFESGNLGFDTDLGYYSNPTGSPSSGQYSIGTYVTPNQSYWSATTDNNIDQQCGHDGNFLYADGFGPDHGGGSTEGIVWRQTVTVTPSKDYTFSMDHANICWNNTAHSTDRVAHADATFNIYINGQLMLTTSTDGNGEYNGVCRWKTDTFEWNSLKNTTATIEIRQVRGDTPGRDYAIDNIFFGGPATQTAMVTIGPIKDCFDVIAEASECDGDSVMLSAKAINTVSGEVVGYIDRWEKADDQTVVGTDSPVYVKPTSTTKYVAFGYFPASSIIVNGDFELGLNGFNYGAGKGLYNQGTGVGSFSVLTNPTATSCGTYCVNLGDHTTGSGNMLFVDPQNQDGDVISYDITAEAGKKYAFSLFIANAVNFVANPNGKASSISFIIENAGGVRQTIASIELERDNDWRELSSIWEAPADGDYQLIIRAVGDNYLDGSGGNDFVIDDIRLSTLIDIIYTDTVEVEPCINCQPGKISGDQAICYNTVPAGFANVEAPETAEGTYTIAWEKSTDLLTWTPIAGGNRLSYSETAPLTTDTYYRRKMSSASCTEYFSDTVKVTVAPVVVPGSIEDDQIICVGATPDPLAELTPATGGFDPIEYFWQRSYDQVNWADIPATNLKDYTETASLTDTAWYRRRIETGSCGRVTDINESVTGTDLNQVSYTGTWTNGSDPDQYLGTERYSATAGASYSISFYGTELILFSQMGKDRGIFAVSINGAPETQVDLYADSTHQQVPVYTTGRLPLDTHTVVVRVTGNKHAAATSAIIGLDRAQVVSTQYSNIVQITVQPEITPGAIGQNDTICSNSLPAPFVNLTAATGGMGTHAYQWQKSGDGLAWTDISGANLPTYTETTPLTDTTYYRRKVTSGVCPAQFTDSVEVIVISELKPSITIEADKTSICEDEVVTFSVQSKGGGGAAPTYEWFRNNMKNHLPSPEDNLYQAFNIGDGSEFYAIMTSSEDCATPQTATSNKIVITVKSLPSNAVILENDSSFCISAIDLNATVPTQGTGTWSVRAGDIATLSSATANPVTVSDLNPGATARIYWTVSTGTECPANIDSVDLTRTGTLTAPNPGNDTTICASVTSLQLKNNGVAGETAIFGAVPPATITGSGVAGNFSLGENKFYLTLSNGFCDATDTIIVTVVDVPAQPDPITGPTGIICAATDDNEFSVNAVADATEYAWSISGSGLSLQTPVDETSVKMDAALAASTGLISVAAINQCGNSAPRTYNVTITPVIEPTVTIQATQVSICADSSGKFSIASIGSEITTPAYEWFIYRNGGNVATGETQPSITLTNLQDKDSIFVKVTSDYSCPGAGIANSAKIGMTIIPMKPVSVDIATDLSMPVCEGTEVTFTATPTNGGSTPTYEWRSGGIVLGTTNPIKIPMTATSVITVELTSNELCYDNEAATSNLSYTVTPNVPVIATLIPNNETRCKNEPSPIFTAGGANHGANPVYTWKLNGTQVKKSGDQTYRLASTGNPGIYSVEVIVESTEECVTQKSDAANTNIQILDLPVITISGPDRYCENDFITLQAAGGLSYSWYRNSSSTSSIGSSSSLPVATDGAYILVGRDANNCENSDTLQVSVLAPKATIVSDKGFTECEGVTLNVSIQETADSYVWTKNGAPFATTKNIQVTEPGLYEIEVTQIESVTCKTSSEQAITFLQVPDPQLDYADTLICDDERLIYKVNNYGGSLTWYQDGEAIVASNREIFQIMESGAYHVIENNGYCQETSNTVHVTVEKVPVAYAGADLYIGPGETILLSGLGSRDAYLYEWNSNSWIQPINGPEVSFTPEEKVSHYILTVGSPSGKCVSEDEITVTIEYPVTAWNSFSPNNDGLYDTWIIENIDDYPDAVVEVYNRWGTLVFRSKGYNNSAKAWKGDNYRNGQALPTATYYYIIYPNGGNIRKPITGDVTIVR